MRKFIILFFICFPAIFAQNSFIDKLTFGVQTEIVNPGSDLGEYWGSSYAIGGFAHYKLNENFGYQVEILLSRFDENIKDNKLYPEITVLYIPLTGIAKIDLSEYFQLIPSFGIENIMMIFDETDGRESNLNESEFSVTLSCGIKYKPFDIEIFAKYRNMFSEPENTPFYSLGIRKRLF